MNFLRVHASIIVIGGAFAEVRAEGVKRPPHSAVTPPNKGAGGGPPFILQLAKYEETQERTRLICSANR